MLRSQTGKAGGRRRMAIARNPHASAHRKLTAHNPVREDLAVPSTRSECSESDNAPSEHYLLCIPFCGLVELKHLNIGTSTADFSDIFIYLSELLTCRVVVIDGSAERVAKFFEVLIVRL